MPDPVLARPEPITVELEPGTVWWCSCGMSATQPFCDGSHRGTGMRPRRLEVRMKTRATLCQCKRTGNAPWCDRSHCKL